MLPESRVVSIVVATLFSVLLGASADAATTLLVPQSTAFSVLGHSCGGIQEQVLATGFDVASGFPTGDVYLQTRCGGSGRGGGYRTTTYSKWLDVTWDYTGAVVSSAVLAAPPASIDPTFDATDVFGNRLYDQVTAVNVSPAACAVGNTTYCTYRAYLELAGAFAPPPRITRISVASGPASGGTSVVITGTGFTGASAVDFGATAAAFVVSSDTSITATSPAASAGVVDVVVTTAGGSSVPDANDQFTFVAAPTVTGISPNAGPVSGGTLVTITGAGFVDVTEVDFGETPAGFTVDDDTTITAVSPPGEAPDTVRIMVATIGGTSAASPADVFEYVDAGPATVCGDGTVDPSEECDDAAANGQPGDCCTATCQFVAVGTPCADDDDLCTADACDGVGMCVHPPGPASACTPPDLAKGASLLLRKTRSGRHEVAFTWSKGPAVSAADFGDPTAGDRLRLCVYEQTGGASDYTLAFSGAPVQGSGGAWSARANGWQFRNASGAPDGVTHVALKASPLPLKASLQVTAMKAATSGPLPLPPSTTVVAQLRTSLGTCWGATFSTPTVNGATELKAKSD